MKCDVDLGFTTTNCIQKDKSIISRLPVLVYFDQDKNHIIQSNVLKKGLGAVLLQDGQPVIYASQILRTEQKYSQHRKRVTGCSLCI